jgi:uncharacterized sulfatase
MFWKNVIMKHISKTGVFAAVSLLPMAVLSARPEKPNFLIILADDLGWQDLKCYDIDAPSVFETPHIDQLAAEGILFKQAYAPAPTCAPSRCGIMSGKYPARLNKTHVEGGTVPKPNTATGSRMMDPYYSARLDLDEITIPEELNPSGYFSGHVGKWHLSVSHNSYPQPEHQGFDWTRHSRGITDLMPDRSTGFATTNAADPYRLDENGFAYDQTTEDALAFLAEAAATNRPFFCYYATWLVHTPVQMRTERLLEKYCAKMGIPYPHDGSAVTNPGQNNPYYAAMVETLDYSVHRIVTYLKNTDDPRWPGHKLIENTYIFFTSDNGGMEYADGEYITDNSPLDEGKIHTEEGGTRVPFIVTGPEILSNQVSEVMVNGLDLYPTILALAGIPVPARLDGCDLSALLNDPLNAQSVTNLAGQVRDTMYWHFPHGGELRSTIRKGGWKLFKNYDYVNNPARNPYELYRLYQTNNARADIEEAVDQIASEPGVAAQLENELNQWLTAVNAKVPHYNPKYAGTLPGKESVPVITASGNTNGTAWATFSGGAARAELVYTLNGDGSVDEEWFSTEAVLTAGRAEAVIPDGTTHCLFDLIDTNNFLVSSVDVGQAKDGLKDSAVVPPYVREPGSGSLLLQTGTNFPSAGVVLGNAVGIVNGGQVKDNDASAVTQAAGQSFTLAAPARFSKLTLKSAVNKTFSPGRKMVLWIGAYSNNTAGSTRVYEWVDFSGVPVTNGGYITIDFPDTVFPAGTYAFQLAWPSFDTDHFMNFYRSDTVDSFSDGDRLYKSASAGTSILLPFSNASETGMENKDLVFALHGALEDTSGFASERATVLSLGSLTNAPAMFADDTSMTDVTVNPGELKAVYFDAPDYQGLPTRVYAYVGIPAGASAVNPAPGIVLVHGGGGTAYRDWVSLWTNRGYAAISIAMEGQTDTLATQGQKDAGLAVGNWLKHARPGPARVGIYGDSGVAPITDQWMYHAVADTILANSLLRSLPQVNAQKVGMMGVSWGGVITSTAMGIDDRFAFAIPVYGCGHKYDIPNQYGRALESNDLYRQVWDPMVRIENARMPALWFSWPQEDNFSLDSQAATYRASAGSYMVSLVPGMGHGHAPAWNRPESYAFADSIISNGAPWCRQETVNLSNGIARVTFVSSKTLDQAKLVSTTDSGYTGTRTWIETAAALVNNGNGSYAVTAALPDYTTGWFINGLSGSLVASSEYQENRNVLPPSNVIFDVSADWSSKTVKANDTVIITNGAAVTLDEDGSAALLTVADGALLMNRSRTLSVSGVVAVRMDGSIILNSGLLLPGGNMTIDGSVTLNGGVLSRDVAGVSTSGHIISGNGTVKVHAGLLAFTNGAATDLVKLNTAMEISGGTVDFDGQVYIGDGVPAEFKIVGHDASIRIERLNQGSGGESGIFNFVMDETGVSPVSVSAWMNLSNATIRVDGSAYTGDATNLLLFDSVNLVNAAGADRIEVSGFFGQGLSASVIQDQTDGKDWVQVALVENDYGNWVFSEGFSGAHRRMNADPDGDGVCNLVEYALGGDPARYGIVEIPRFVKASSADVHGLDYVYRRRRDAAARRLFYRVEVCTNLQAAVWTTNGCEETGSSALDDSFESVTNRIEPGASRFLRLKIEAGL